MGHHANGQIVTYGQCGTYFQGADFRVLAQGLFQFGGLGQQGLGLGPVQPAQLVQLQALAYTVEQLDVELVFQFLQGTAGSRLRHGQGFRSPGDVLEVGGGKEDFELTETVFHDWSGTVAAFLMGEAMLSIKSNRFMRTACFVDFKQKVKLVTN